MLEEIKKMFGELGCVCLYESDDTLKLMTNECVLFDVLKVDDVYIVCENEEFREPFYIREKFRGGLTMDDVKEVVDSIRDQKIDYRNEGIDSFRKLKLDDVNLAIYSFMDLKIESVNEAIDSNWNASVMPVVNKLIELDVENISVDQNKKIEFEWCDRTCSYKNKLFFYGSESVMPIDNIEKLDANFLNLLVGKLTSEQLKRVDNLIDLFEVRFELLLSQQECLESNDLMETELYQEIVQELSVYVFTFVNLYELIRTEFLEDAFNNTDILEDSTRNDILRYILKG